MALTRKLVVFEQTGWEDFSEEDRDRVRLDFFRDALDELRKILQFFRTIPISMVEDTIDPVSGSVQIEAEFTTTLELKLQGKFYHASSLPRLQG